MKERMTKLSLAGGTLLIAGGAATGWAIHDAEQAREAYTKEQSQNYSSRGNDSNKSVIKEETAKRMERDMSIAGSGLLAAAVGAFAIGQDIYLSKGSKFNKEQPANSNLENTINKKNLKRKKIENISTKGDIL
jgi:hypothetical protein